MGNSRWRLETSINLTVLNAKKANCLSNLEIIISDWGSDVPLSDVLLLIPDARDVVKFVHIPINVAVIEQKDSKFPEVIALNAAARNATGEFIGRIDNDTIVGSDFFHNFMYLHNQNSSESLDLSDSFLFVERRSVPYRISRLSLPLSQINWFIRSFSKFLKIESATDWGKKFWCSPVGIMIFHRDIWHATQGYDERLISWGWMEGDLALRIGQHHRVVEFSNYVGHDLYHLEHYSNLVEYKDRNGAATPRKKNEPKYDNLNYRENSASWGLNNFSLSLDPYTVVKQKRQKEKSLLGAFLLCSGIVLLLKDKILEIYSRIAPSFRIFVGKINPFR